MSTKRVVDLVRKNKIVAFKVDITTDWSPDMAELYEQLGLMPKSVPFLVVYPANGNPPIVFDGIVTEKQVVGALQKAVTGKGS